jgi:predicted YcjX-like family ATPase
MPLRIAQVVYTLAQFPTVTSVQFKVDGQRVTVLGGVPVQSPQTTGMYDGYLPAIPVSYTVTRAEPGTIEVFESSPKKAAGQRAADPGDAGPRSYLGR